MASRWTRERTEKNALLGIRPLAMVLGMVGLGTVGAACILDLPYLPSISVRRDERLPAPSGTPSSVYDPNTEYESISPIAELIVHAAGDVDLKRLGIDAAYRCEQNLASYRNKMRDARNARTAITVLGAVLTASGALTTTVLGAVAAAKDPKTDTSHDLDVGVVAAGGLTAALSILNIIPGQIAEPTDVRSKFNQAYREYNEAHDALIDLKTPGPEYDQRFARVLKKLNQCAGPHGDDDEKSPRNTQPAPPPPPPSGASTAPAPPSGATSAPAPPSATGTTPAAPSGASSAPPASTNANSGREKNGKDE